MSKAIARLNVCLGVAFYVLWGSLLAGCSPSTPAVEPTPLSPTEVPTPTAAPTLSQRIDEAENLWRVQGIADYRIEVEVGSSWSSYVYTIAVVDGEIADALVVCQYDDAFGSDCPPPETFDPEEFTVPGLFARLHTYAGTDAEDWVEVTFDEEAGYPRKFSYDEPESIDEEWGWHVKTFEPASGSG